MMIIMIIMIIIIIIIMIRNYMKPISNRIEAI